MDERQPLPDPADVSHDHLVKPAPPAHEFRFRIRTLLILLLLAAVVAAFVRILLSL